MKIHAYVIITISFQPYTSGISELEIKISNMYNINSSYKVKRDQDRKRNSRKIPGKVRCRNRRSGIVQCDGKPVARLLLNQLLEWLPFSHASSISVPPRSKATQVRKSRKRKSADIADGKSFEHEARWFYIHRLYMRIQKTNYEYSNKTCRVARK